MKSLGFKRFTNVASATVITAAAAAGKTTAGAPTDSRDALIQVEGQPIRILGNNETPTATNGFLLEPNQSMYWDYGQLDNVRVIETVAGATVTVLFFG